MLNEPLRRIPGFDRDEEIDGLYTVDQLDEFGWLHGLPKAISLKNAILNIGQYGPDRPKPPSLYLGNRRMWRRSILLRVINGEWTVRKKAGRPRHNPEAPTPLADQPQAAE